MLTGFAEIDLVGTGLTQPYLQQVTAAAGDAVCNDLWAAAASLAQRFPQPSAERDAAIRAEILASSRFGPVARALLKMWYLGRWEQMPAEWRQQYGTASADENRVISGLAYKQSLVWRACGTHPPGARASGFGTWADAPPVALVKGPR